jgi:hypothetical protein
MLTSNRASNAMAAARYILVLTLSHMAATVVFGAVVRQASRRGVIETHG